MFPSARKWNAASVYPGKPFALIGEPDRPRLITIKTRQDFTDRMEAWARKRVVEIEGEELCGFIFKGGSPSSGMERVKVYDGKGVPAKIGVGIFARIFMEHFPLIPVEEEGRLHDPVLRENFIERIFALRLRAGSSGRDACLAASSISRRTTSC